MPPEIIEIINQIGLPGIIIVGMWYGLRHMELRNNEKDKLIYEILREGQMRIESHIKLVLDLSREDTHSREELRKAVEHLVESQNGMLNFITTLSKEKA